METIAAVIGIGIYCMLLLYIAFNLGQEHTIWKIFTILYVIFTLTLLVKASVDTYSDCEQYTVQVNTINSSYTEYEVVSACPINEKTTGVSFLKANSLLVWTFSIYLLVFFLWVVSNGFAGFRWKK